MDPGYCTCNECCNENIELLHHVFIYARYQYFECFTECGTSVLWHNVSGSLSFLHSDLVDNAPMAEQAPRSAIELRLKEAGGRLHGRRRQLVMAILQDAAETCFLSSPEVARRYNVDAATVVRTVQALGYERYANFGADLREHLLSRLSPYAISRSELQAERSFPDRIRHSIQCDIENLQSLASGLDINAVIRASEEIQRARRIYVIGVDAATGLSQYLAYVLRTLGFAAESLVTSEGYLQHTAKLMSKEDMLIAISFGRCLRMTVDMALAAKHEGAPTFGITDSPNSPLARACDHSISAPIAGSLLFGSYVAPLAAIRALVVACAYHNPDELLHRLEQMEKDERFTKRWAEPPLGETRMANGKGKRGATNGGRSVAKKAKGK